MVGDIVKKICNKKLLLLAAMLLAAVAEPSFAIDTSDFTGIVGSSGDAATAIEEVGAAMLGLAGVAITFKWAKAAIFG